jgi:acetyl-CoA synthetase
VPIFSGFGVRAVVDRLMHCGASVLVAADGISRRGTFAGRRDDLREIMSRVDAISLCITVPSSAERTGGTTFRDELAWPDALAADPGDRTSQPCSAEHPLMIAYTSGTTGTPKGVSVGHAGFGVKAASDAALIFDLGRADVACWVTDPGWVMWPITLLGGLIAGSAVAILDGTPDYPHVRRLWDFADSCGVTMLGVSPTLIRSLMERDARPLARPSRLRVLGSSGEPLTADAFDWLHRQVGQGCLPIINYTGGTEVSGGILSNTVTEPIRPSRFAGPVPGMGAIVVDPGGEARTQGVGELALQQPSPGMPLGFWDEPGRYASTYWSHWPGRWRHGDWVEITTEGDYVVHGRADDVLTVAGKRIGPAEIEAVVNDSRAVVESAAIGVPDDVKGEAVVVFARPGPSHQGLEQLRNQIVANVASQLGRPLRPRNLFFVDDLPRTASGKIVRRVVRRAHLDHDFICPPTVANPDSLAAIRSPS